MLAERFKAGEVYNIGSEDYHSIEEVADIILWQLGKERRRDDLLVYRPSETLTTRSKRVDCSKARRDLGHRTSVSLEKGIAATVAWMKEVYGC
jgi:dTDP-glucose 4,6-dehydratase